MTLLRCNVVLKHRSGLPRDNVTNTFHVNARGPGQEVLESVAERIRDFYVEPTNEPNAFPLTRWYGPSVANAGHEVRVYPINTITGESLAYEGAPPAYVETFDLLGRVLPDNGEPSEVALCLSYKNVSSGNVPQAQRRGRIYLGPFTNNVVAPPDAAGVSRPVPDLLTYWRRLGEKLRDELDGDGDKWVIYSRPFAGRPETPRPGRRTLPALPARPGWIYEVEQLWMDNSFDTVRRRGETATIRDIGLVG